MNAAELHLLVNHVPGFSLVFAVALMVASLLKPFSPAFTKGIRVAALLLLVIAGPFAIVSVFSGESAHELVEGIPAISMGDIHAHEEAAEFAMWVAIVISLFAAYMLYVQLTGRTPFRGANVVLWVLLLFGLVVVLRTEHLGGKIRHPEITKGWEPPAATTDSSPEMDDD